MKHQTMVHERQVGEVTHYWPEIGVAGVHLIAPLDIGDHIHVLGHTSDFEQFVKSIEVQHHYISHAKAGEDVAVKVAEHARENDKVFQLTEDDIGRDESNI